MTIMSSESFAASQSFSMRKKFLYSFCVLVVFFGGLEVLFRFLGIGSPPEVADYIANWRIQWQGEFYTVKPNPIYGVNTDGVRDYQHKVANSENHVRVVCLGDSVTAGYGLEYEDSFPAILEQRLTNAGRSVEVFNVALPGWSTRQEFIAYSTIVRKYKPDLVILGICLNDVAEMQNNTSRPPASVAWLNRYSYLFRSMIRSESQEISRVEELFQSPNARHVQHGWEVCQGEILKLADAVNQDGCRFVMIVFPFRFQVEPHPPQPFAQERLSGFAKTRGIEMLDVLPALQPVGPQAFYDYDHLSKIGADAVATRIIDSGVILVD
jgi:lysophospholipase L1-like esterase